MDLSQFLDPRLLILIPVMWAIGNVIKQNSIIPNWLIPLILLTFAVAFCVGVMGLSIDSIIQAFVLWGMTISGNQLYKQTMEGIKKDDLQQLPPPEKIEPTNTTEFRK
ncbi:MAG: hypothetical protein K0S61_111 [Anaerocolumna sp.]|jgi:hypothetical protein|nr:hypothetical protein [Anaerocolumna sp.]